jgi:HEAT repeat protein
MFLWWWKRKLRSRSTWTVLRAIDKIARYSESPEAAQLLLEVMRDGNYRGSAILGLGRIRHRCALPALLEVLASGYYLHEVNLALGQIDPRWRSSPEAAAAHPKLLQSFVQACQQANWSPGDKGSEDPDVIHLGRLAQRLVEMDDRRALPAFLEAVRSDKDINPPLLVRGLLQWAEPAQAVDAILDLMRRRRSVHSSYIGALGTLRDRRAIPALILSRAIANDSAAATSLRAIDPQWAQSPEARTAVPELLRLLREHLQDERWREGSSAARTSVERVSWLLVRILEIAPQWAQSTEARAAVPKLIRLRTVTAPSESSAGERIQSALDLIDARWPRLPEAQPDYPRQLLRSADLAMLVRLAAEPLIPALRRREVLEALPLDDAAARPAVRACLLEALAGADKDVAKAAAHALHRLILPADLPALVALVRRLVAMTRDKHDRSFYEGPGFAVHYGPELVERLRDVVALIGEVLRTEAGGLDTAALQTIRAMNGGYAFEWLTLPTGVAGDGLPPEPLEHRQEVIDCRPIKALAAERMRRRAGRP